MAAGCGHPERHVVRGAGIEPAHHTLRPSTRPRPSRSAPKPAFNARGRRCPHVESQERPRPGDTTVITRAQPLCAEMICPTGVGLFLREAACLLLSRNLSPELSVLAPTFGWHTD